MLSALLAAALCLTLTACGGNETAEAEIVPTAAPAMTTPTPAEKSAKTDRDAADKEETVYVQAAADGAVRKVTVETVLNYGGAGGVIEDRTALSDIKNTEGDEEFTLEDGGVLLWEDHGERIRYEGTGAAALPVEVHISYWLDGEEISPEALAGKSGRVRIRFDYENRTGETVTVTHADLSDEDEPAEPETEAVDTVIPFLAISVALLPEDVFTNVSVENGRVVSLGGQTAVLGYALPGLREALAPEEFEPMEDMDIPEYVELEADAEDFKLDFTATVLTNGLFGELEAESLDDIEKLSDGVGKLAEASEALADGAGELADGAREFADGVSEYADGVWQVYDGAAALGAGLSAISETTDTLRGGVEAASRAAEWLKEALSGAETAELTDTAAALEAVIAGLDAFQAALAGAEDYADEVRAAAAIADNALADIELDASAALAGLDLTDEERAAVEAYLARARGAVDEARARLADIPDYAEELDLTARAAALYEAAGALRERAEALLEEAETLPASPAEALERVEAAISGASALCDALDTLAAGSAALKSGVYALGTAGDTLAEAAEALADGAGELADGLAEFDEEGISELTDLAGEDLAALVTRLRALRQADIAYENFGGIAEGRTGSVRFVIETDAIG